MHGKRKSFGVVRFRLLNLLGNENRQYCVSILQVGFAVVVVLTVVG